MLGTKIGDKEEVFDIIHYGTSKRSPRGAVFVQRVELNQRTKRHNVSAEDFWLLENGQRQWWTKQFKGMKVGDDVTAESLRDIMMGFKKER